MTLFSSGSYVRCLICQRNTVHLMLCIRRGKLLVSTNKGLYSLVLCFRTMCPKYEKKSKEKSKVKTKQKNVLASCRKSPSVPDLVRQERHCFCL